MSHNYVSRRSLTAILIVALSTLLACASKGPKDTSPTPAYSDDTASIANGGGKTIENLLAGRFPGVSVTAVEGGRLQIRIRGGSNTFYGSNEPLIVVDDTPFLTSPGGIVFLNPYDIQKIEVLKNPADTGLYGVRGANGVIKITMKKPGMR